MKTNFPLRLALFVALALCACEEERKAPPAPPPVAKKSAVDKPATGPAQPAYVYAYNPLGKRDPFRSPVIDRASGAGNTSESQCGEPLCQYDLDQLTLVAVVTGEANPIAMVEDPEGRGFVVRRNTKMGKQGGRVSQILRDSVVVTEYWAQPDGKKIPNPRTLNLKPDIARAPPIDLQTGRPVQ